MRSLRDVLCYARSSCTYCTYNGSWISYTMSSSCWWWFALFFGGSEHTPRARSISWLVCRADGLLPSAFCLLPLNPHSPSEHWLSRTSFHRLDGLLQGMMPAKERATMHRHSRHQPATNNTTNNDTRSSSSTRNLRQLRLPAADRLAQPPQHHHHQPPPRCLRLVSAAPRPPLRQQQPQCARPTAWQQLQQESRKVLAWH